MKNIVSIVCAVQILCDWHGELVSQICMVPSYDNPILTIKYATVTVLHEVA